MRTVIAKHLTWDGNFVSNSYRRSNNIYSVKPISKCGDKLIERYLVSLGA